LVVTKRVDNRKPTILLVEDSVALAEVYVAYLRDEPYVVRHVADGRSTLAELDHAPPEVLLLDLKLPDMDGMDILRHVHREQMPTSVVIITGHGSVDLAVDAMRYGAFDFVEKPFDAKRLKVTLRNALEHQALSDLVDRIKEDFQRERYHGFIGGSLAMQSVYRIIDSAAPSRATVFITGESGTGKEVCADAIHRQSPRRAAPFVALNCGAIPRDLMESEIFGHVKGAFTGAAAERIGAAGQADGGTLFLDEIGEMGMDLQTKLLRFVQTGTLQKVGGTRPENVDVRFICATNKDPLKAVAEGRFREDLYYRLNVIPIHLPALRDRREDVLPLARHFLSRFAAEEGKPFRGLSPEVEAILTDYDWPGNVRQLQNVIRNVVVLHAGGQVTAAMLPAPLDAMKQASSAGPAVADAGRATSAQQSDSASVKPLWLIEKEAIERAIDHCDGNIPRAAALLEVSPSTIYRKRQAWLGSPE
jgi:two-component system repressor protein LuxO